MSFTGHAISEAAPEGAEAEERGPEGQGPSSEEKALLISGVTDLLQRVLNKNPATTFVVIDEVPLENWGMEGRQVSEIRNLRKALAAVQIRCFIPALNGVIERHLAVSVWRL